MVHMDLTGQIMSTTNDLIMVPQLNRAFGQILVDQLTQRLRVAETNLSSSKDCQVLLEMTNYLVELVELIRSFHLEMQSALRIQRH